MKLKDLLNEGNDKYSPKEIKKMYLALSEKWQKSLDKYFLGNTITTKANKHGGRHSWETHTISNIKQVKIGSYFSTDINVVDENGDWYTLLNQD